MLDNSVLDMAVKYTHVFLDPSQRRDRVLSVLYEQSYKTKVKFLNYMFLFESLKAGALCEDETRFSVRVQSVCHLKGSVPECPVRF